MYGIFILAIIGLLFTKFKLFSLSGFMKGVAQSRGYSYAKEAPMSSVSGGLFEVGENRRIVSVISGRADGQDIRAYYYNTAVGPQNAELRTYTILEYQYTYELPHMLLTTRALVADYVDDAAPTFMGSKLLTLEGNFNEKFTLQVEEEFEIEALQIFTPDVMQELIDQKIPVQFETCENKLYLFQKKYITTTEGMSALFELGALVNRILTPHFKETSDDVADMKEVTTA